MMTDPIGDMLTRIRNANVAFHDEESARRALWALAEPLAQQQMCVQLCVF